MKEMFKKFIKFALPIIISFSLIVISSFPIFAETPSRSGVSAPLFISPDNEQQLLHKLATELVSNRVVQNATVQDVYDCLVAGTQNMTVAEMLYLCTTLLNTHFSRRDGYFIDQLLYDISLSSDITRVMLETGTVNTLGREIHTIMNVLAPDGAYLRGGSIGDNIFDLTKKLHSIDWSYSGTFSGLTSTFTGSWLVNGSVLNPGEYFAFYKVDYSFNADNGYYKFFIPINRSYMTAKNIKDIQFVDSWNNNGVEYKHLDYTLSYDNSRGGYNIYVRDYTIDSSSNLYEVIKFKIDVAMTYQTNSLDTKVYFISDDNIDFHYLKLGFNSDDMRSILKENLPLLVQLQNASNSMLGRLGEYIYTTNSYLGSLLSSTNSIKNYLTTEQSSRLMNIHDYISNIKANIADLKYMYADDDMIARKQAGQATESAALDAFSGQGSAAATASDVGTFKDISGTIKNGLYTGADASAIYGVMTNPKSFFGWFSQENYVYINSPHQMPNYNTRLRSAPNSDDVIDFYIQNQIDVDYLLDFYKQGGDK